MALLEVGRFGTRAQEVRALQSHVDEGGVSQLNEEASDAPDHATADTHGGLHAIVAFGHSFHLVRDELEHDAHYPQQGYHQGAERDGACVQDGASP